MRRQFGLKMLFSFFAFTEAMKVQYKIIFEVLSDSVYVIVREG